MKRTAKNNFASHFKSGLAFAICGISLMVWTPTSLASDAQVPAGASRTPELQNRCIDSDGRLSFSKSPCPAFVATPSTAPAKAAATSVSTQTARRATTDPFAFRLKALNFDTLGQISVSCYFEGRIDKSGEAATVVDLTTVYADPDGFGFCSWKSGCSERTFPSVDLRRTDANATVMRRIETAVFACQSPSRSPPNLNTRFDPWQPMSYSWWRLIGTMPDGTERASQMYPWTGRLPK